MNAGHFPLCFSPIARSPHLADFVTVAPAAKSLRFWRRNCGDSIFVPSETVKNVFNPKSKPAALLGVTSGMLHSNRTEKHSHKLPTASRFTVTVLMQPSISRLLIYLIHTTLNADPIAAKQLPTRLFQREALVHLHPLESWRRTVQALPGLDPPEEPLIRLVYSLHNILNRLGPDLAPKRMFLKLL